jgi:hypothetical protein
LAPDSAPTIGIGGSNSAGECRIEKATPAATRSPAFAVPEVAWHFAMGSLGYPDLGGAKIELLHRTLKVIS